ncbi:MAG: 3-deoxy-D-manno-octulosonic acid transferase [Alphaproteobacteria bacterium MarineAlpha3_Bin7]|nr:MAG: 3-deoxy-D-manno-octulosonic acid transferase [Alphaproteobacteria bacterium MarineAlpha3_Bin7]
MKYVEPTRIKKTINSVLSCKKPEGINPIIKFYQIFMLIITPILPLYLQLRVWNGKEEVERLPERYGKSNLKRPEGKLIWIHAASVGESLSILPLIDLLIKHDNKAYVLLTTGTISSATLMRERLPDKAFHQYAPVDHFKYVQNFLNFWNPDVGIWTESEFWPNLIIEAKNHGVPIGLINGRISDKSFRRWKRLGKMISIILKKFDFCLGQTESDTNRLAVLGAKKYEYLGNLKFSSPPLPVNKQELSNLKSQLQDRPCWLAASTHKGEEEIVADVHQKLKDNYNSILTVIVPRHPERGEEIFEKLSQYTNLTISRRSRGNSIDSDTDIYLADTIGELGLFFSLSKITFMGKSLVPLGGQNPIEPLKLGSAVIHGPHMSNFTEIVKELCEFDCAVQIDDPNQLFTEIFDLLSNKKKIKNMIENGKIYINSKKLVAENIKNRIVSLF